MSVENEIVVITMVLIVRDKIFGSSNTVLNDDTLMSNI